MDGHLRRQVFLLDLFPTAGEESAFIGFLVVVRLRCIARKRARLSTVGVYSLLGLFGTLPW